MIIHFYPNADEPRLSHLEIKADDPDDILRIKRLPRWWYDHVRDIWIVPLTIGLAIKLEKSESFFGLVLLALVQYQEAALIQDIVQPARRMTIEDMYNIGAAEAVHKAYEHHHLTVHRGDDADYVSVHGVPDYAPVMSVQRRVKKADIEVTRRLLKQGRKD